MTKTTKDLEPMTLEQFKQRKTTLDLFPTNPCRRCGGCGRYSFNLRDGDRCYGCGGTGLQFTPRGKRQAAAYDELKKKMLADVKVGDLISYLEPTISGGFIRRRCTVQSIEPTEDGKWREMINGQWVEHSDPQLKVVTDKVTIIGSLTDKETVLRSTEETYALYLEALKVK